VSPKHDIDRHYIKIGAVPADRDYHDVVRIKVLAFDDILVIKPNALLVSVCAWICRVAEVSAANPGHTRLHRTDASHTHTLQGEPQQGGRSSQFRGKQAQHHQLGIRGYFLVRCTSERVEQSVN
jgi:hypothetical protein